MDWLRKLLTRLLAQDCVQCQRRSDRRVCLPCVERNRRNYPGGR